MSNLYLLLQRHDPDFPLIIVGVFSVLKMAAKARAYARALEEEFTADYAEGIQGRRPEPQTFRVEKVAVKGALRKRLKQVVPDDKLDRWKVCHLARVDAQRHELGLFPSVRF
jgi:hypothetical protein